MSQKFTFEHTLEEINLLLTALGELPAKLSIDLIHKLKFGAEAQAAEQAATEASGLKAEASTAVGELTPSVTEGAELTPEVVQQ